MFSYAWVCLILVQGCTSLEFAQDLIDARRLHLVHFKASHWKPFLRCIDENLPVTHVDSQCRADAQRFVQAMLAEEPSGLSLLDSLGSLPTGMLRGSVLEYGSPELCFGAQVRNKTGTRISSKFCHVYVYLPADVPVPPVAPRMQQGVQNFVFDQSSLRLGGCFPSTCGDQDISLILNQCLATWQLATVVSLCDDNEPWEGPPLFVMFFLGAFVAAVCLATVLDICSNLAGALREKPFPRASLHGPLEKLKALSVVRSFRSIFVLPSQRSNLDAFHGLRVLGTFWVITSHTSMFTDVEFYDNVDELYKLSSSWMRQFIVNASLHSCIFFTMGGFMMWVTFSRRWEKDRGNTSLFNIALHRYLRLFPLLWAIHCLHQLVPVSGHGPQWSKEAEMRAGAFTKHWPHYIMGTFNNLHLDDIQSPQHWYSAVDFQLFVFSLYFVLRLKRTGQARLLVALLLASMCTTFLVTKLNNLNAGTFYFTPVLPSEMGNDPASLYYTPYVHFVSYCLGILAAFYHSKHGTDDIGKAKQVLLWVASLLCMSGVLFGSILWNSGGEAPSPWVAALYKATHRALFSAGLCWIMFACVTGRAGFINNILSWPAWVPLSRLSFGSYMIHDFILFYQWLNFRNRINEGYFFLMTLVAGNFAASFAASFLLHAFLEKPIVLMSTVVEEMLPRFLPQRWRRADPASQGTTGSARPFTERSKAS
ncbi:nose resistant to fluoxetine protein 6-like isoform X1 [Ixodes scapularis]